jgi:hypothetical protein
MARRELSHGSRFARIAVTYAKFCEHDCSGNLWTERLAQSIAIEWRGQKYRNILSLYLIIGTTILFALAIALYTQC